MCSTSVKKYKQFSCGKCSKLCQQHCNILPRVVISNGGERISPIRAEADGKLLQIPRMGKMPTVDTVLSSSSGKLMSSSPFALLGVICSGESLTGVTTGFLLPTVLYPRPLLWLLWSNFAFWKAGGGGQKTIRWVYFGVFVRWTICTDSGILGRKPP